jgi:hypothetical protein
MRPLKTLLIIFLLSFSVLAQEVKKESETNKIPLSQEDSKSFQAAIDKANKEIEQTRKEADMASKLAEQTARANNLEVQNLYLQLKDRYKIDLAKWDFNMQSMQWIEKPLLSAAPTPATQPK